MFVTPGSGGYLDASTGLLFGPDGNGDGHQDLYVSGSHITGALDRGNNGSVKRYDGITGDFIDTFIPTGSGGLIAPSGLWFTHTDPVTLNYLGGGSSFAAAQAIPEPTSALLLGLAAVCMCLRCWRVA